MEEIEENKNAQIGSDVEMIEVHTPNFFEQHFLHILSIFGIGFLIFTFIFQLYLSPIYIVGRSMQPTINAGSTSAADEKHTDLIYYHAQDSYQKQDIVIIDASDYLNEASIIKRIIATAGDTLTFEFDKIEQHYHSLNNGNHIEQYITYSCYYKLKLNGEPLVEDYILSQENFVQIITNESGEFYMPDSTGQFKNNNGYAFLKSIYNELYDESTKKLPTYSSGELGAQDKCSYSITISENNVFACGDNRNISIDSKYFGEIPLSCILGKSVLHIAYNSNLFVGLWNAIFN